MSGSTLTITGVGTVVVVANQAGNTNYAAAPQVTQSIVVNYSTPIANAGPPQTVYLVFVADVVGNYVVQLIVNDGFSNRTPSTVTISTIDSPPAFTAILRC